MTGRTARVAMLLAALAMPGWAEAPQTSPRPEARPGSESAQPVAGLRPVARPVTPVSPAVDAPTPGANVPPPDASPVVASDGPVAPAAPTAPDIPRQEALAEARMDAPRQLPALNVTIAAPDDPDRTPDIDGPRQMVVAEILMQMPPPPLVFVDEWTGDAPPLRPGDAGVVADSGGSAFLRPEVRPESLPVVDAVSARSVPRPRARPAAPVDPSPLVAAAPDTAPVYGVGSAPGAAPDAPQFSTLAVAVAMRPPARTARVVEQASSVRRETARGMVCGNPAIQGEVISAIRDGGGCGVEEPVQIRSIGGVSLSAASIMDCNTAEALLSWVNASAIPTLRGDGGGLAGLQIMGSYTCRPRNNQAGARLSEHGKGKAVDIGGFVLASGEVVTVLNSWGSRSYGERLRSMHRDACGTFGTVLGPNANSQHANHFHFDTASHNNGAYCR